MWRAPSQLLRSRCAPLHRCSHRHRCSHGCPLCRFTLCICICRSAICSWLPAAACSTDVLSACSARRLRSPRHQGCCRTHAACGTEPRPRLDAATLRTGTGEDTGAQTRTWMQRLLTGHCQDSRKQEARGARPVAAHRHAAAHRSSPPPCQAPPARRHAAELPGHSCAAALQCAE